MQLSASDIQLGAAILAGAGAGDGSAEGLRHRLKPVADTEHRNTEVEHRGVKLRRTLGVDTGRAARQHDGLRVFGLDLLDGGGMGNDLGVHPRLADPARYQLSVLSAEVDHQHGTRGSGCHLISLRAGVPHAF